MKKKTNTKEKLFEIMGKLDSSFKTKINESQEDNLEENDVISENKNFKINFLGDEIDVYLETANYQNNDALAVQLIDAEDGSVFATVSVNLPESSELPPDEFYLKNWSENEEIAMELIKLGVIIPTGKSARSGYVVADSYKINPNFNFSDITESDETIKYRAEVAGRGENVWSTNALTFDTPEEAQKWLDGLKGRWFGYDLSRVVPVTTPKRQNVDLDNDDIYQNFR